jgi:hypothetical protein
VSAPAEPPARCGELARVCAAVSAAVEGVFGTVAAVHAAALRPTALTAFRTGRPVLDDDVRELLRAPGQLAVGLGSGRRPTTGRELPLRLEWWQVDPDGGALRTLEPDLKPSSLGYYDYTATEWFDVPRRTGRRHLVGPYVDVHGTGRYLLTLTEPVLVDGEFVGRGRGRRVGAPVREPPAAVLGRGCGALPAAQRRGPGRALDGAALAGRRAGGAPRAARARHAAGRSPVAAARRRGRRRAVRLTRPGQRHRKQPEGRRASLVL